MQAVNTLGMSVVFSCFIISYKLLLHVLYPSFFYLLIPKAAHLM